MSKETFNSDPDILEVPTYFPVQANHHRILEEFAHYPLVIDLPYKKNVHQSQVQSTQKTMLSPYTIQPQLYSKLQEFSRDRGYPIFDLLKIVWGALISHYSNQEKLVLFCLSEYSSIYFHDNNNSFLDALSSVNLNNMRLIDLSEDLLKNFSLSVAIEYVNNKKSNDHSFYSLNSAELLLTCQEKDRLDIQIIASKNLFPALILQQIYPHFANILEILLNNKQIALAKVSCLSSEAQKS